MKFNRKKGFTIIELVIVIAVIGILAAVLVPTFTRLIRKSRISTDTQLIRNLNTALESDKVETEHKTMESALNAAKAYGYDISKINASATNNEILWDSQNDVFCYYNQGELEYLPDSVDADKKLKATDYRLWKIYTAAPKDGENFSIYVAGQGAADYVNTHDVNVGVDCGDYTIQNVSYQNTGDARDVVIRTNSTDTVVTLNARQDSASVYGTAKVVNGENVADSSLHIEGSVPTVLIGTGRVVFEGTAETGVVIPTSANAIIAYSEALAKENYPITQRVAGVNTYKIQETKADEDSTIITESIVTFTNDNDTEYISIKDATTNEESKANQVAKDVQGSSAKPVIPISTSNATNVANGTSTNGITKQTNGIILNLEQLKTAVAQGGEYKLAANFTVTTTLTVNKELSLDLNGCVLETSVSSGKHTTMFNNCSKITIKDTSDSEQGRLIGRTTIMNFGEVYLLSGSIEAADNGGGAAVWNREGNGSSLTMSGGHLYATGGAAGSNSSNCIVNYATNTTVTITGGTLTSAAMVMQNQGTLKILGTKDNYIQIVGGAANFNCLKNVDSEASIDLKFVSIKANVGGCIENCKGYAVIESCNFKQVGLANHNSTAIATSGNGHTVIKSLKNESYQDFEESVMSTQNYCVYIFNSGGVVDIEGGTFIGGKNVLKTDDGGQINVIGGNFTGTYSTSGTGSINIMGGTFSVDPSSYLASGKTATQNGSIWVVD